MARREPLFDPYELGARRSDPEFAALEPLPPLPGARRNSALRLLGYGVAGVVVLSLIRGGNGSTAPRPPGSCTQPAASFAGKSVKTYGGMRWSASGPADASVVIGIDTSALPTTGGTGRLAGPVALTGCRASGVVGIEVPAGRHVLTAYLVKADGTATVLLSQPIGVEP